ncbi:hypothetical protein [Sporomusa acidovorans]|uniref:Uncharacterized protein n=1 Tax=Sporomusa acidovorans (strain ATCC 49682 / DSM 3132 / Mol) TaxID=1123286 RepID=A0ABZ3J9J3_SPOA4|nr:hypothetical protein [Sporomusa acidovorans]OZC17540.1 hypothetical protein SPACI_37860 [Sporomusa acidovorans DSM 3132]SDF08982.1 hypothetical protein SAMN04488499_103255 [Sporomusa acidovorans]
MAVGAEFVNIIDGAACSMLNKNYRGILINIGVFGPLKGAILIGMELAAAKHYGGLQK